MRDSISLERIKQLHPKCRTLFKGFIEECENEFGIILRIMNPVFRSIAQQNELYKQGRSFPGKIVTNAKGGSSFHNYGLAIDICEFNENKEVNWNFDNSKLTTIAHKYGLEWGGDWHTIKDKPHFQKTFGYTWQKLLELFNEGKVDNEGYVII